MALAGLRIALVPVAGVLIATVIVPQFGEAARALRVVGTVSPPLVTAGVLLELISLAAFALLTRHAFPFAVRPRFGTVLRADLISVGIGNTLPFGAAPALAARVRLFVLAGAPAAAATGAIVVEGVVSNQALAAIFGAGMLGSSGLLSGLDRGAVAAGAPHGLTWTVGLIGCAALVGCAVGLIGLTLLRRPALVLLARITRPLGAARSAAVVEFVDSTLTVIAAASADRRRLGAVALWASVNWLADAAALGVLLAAFGERLPIASLFFAYGLAAILNAVPLTPGGVGIVEGVLVPVLVGLGVPGGRAVLGVTAWRLVQFWMPIPIAALAAATLLRRRRR
jgi:uncharacterized membrane protein YbhN (UPF0104 family)